MLLAHLHILGYEQGVRTALCPSQPGLLTQLCSVFLGEKALTFFGKEEKIALIFSHSYLPVRSSRSALLELMEKQIIS